MARERASRAPAGPGRGGRRPRTPRSAPSATEPTRSPSGERRAGAMRLRLPARLGRARAAGFGVTKRALVLIGVLAILAVSYAPSLRTLLNQQRERAATTQQIQQREQQVQLLEAELERWRDPNFVISRARSELGWVLPGETGYRVVGADGTVVSVGDDSVAVLPAAAAPSSHWWDRLAASARAADAAEPTATPRP